MNILLYNFIAYLVWFLYELWSQKRITVHVMLVGFYTLIAFLGFLTVENGIYVDTFGWIDVEKLTVTPYLCCFATYYMLFFPFRQLHMRYIRCDFLFTPVFRAFVVVWLVYFVLYSVLKVTEAGIAVSTGLAEMYEARHYGGETLFEYTNPILEKFNGYGYFILNATTPIIMCYAIIGMRKKKVNNILAYILMLTCFVPSLANAIAMGTRGGMFMTIFCFLFFVVLLRRYISKSFLRNLYVIVFGFAVVVLIYSWIITVGRVGEGMAGINSILRYFGESFPNLGFEFWDKVIYHPMGSRMFPNIFGGETFSSVGDAHDFWSQQTGVRVLIFKTYFGDLYIEYGVLGAFLFVIIGTALMLLVLRLKKFGVLILSVLYYYFQLCVNAFAGMTKDGHGAMFQLLIIGIITLFLLWLRYHASEHVERGGFHNRILKQKKRLAKR